MKKRPWKDYAQILRTETNGGDVKYEAQYAACGPVLAEVLKQPKLYAPLSEKFESLAEAEAHLDKWFADFWPQQIKSSRRA